MPLISVVIPVHGVEDYLDRCLESVLSDPSAAVEVIAVDDASPDRCGAILAARQDPRLRVLTTTTAVGPGPARDLGAKEAAGEYVWFVDGDDEVADGALAAVAGALTRLRPDVLVIDFESLYPDGSVSPSGGAQYLRGSAPEPNAVANDRYGSSACGDVPRPNTTALFRIERLNQGLACPGILPVCSADARLQRKTRPNMRPAASGSRHLTQAQREAFERMLGRRRIISAIVHTGGSSRNATKMAHSAGCFARVGTAVFSSQGKR
jgi:glycosyltransferase involved in cell wall biosynthesis